MTMNKPLHSTDDIDTTDVSKKEGRRGLDNLEDTVVASIRELGKMILKMGEKLI